MVELIYDLAEYEHARDECTVTAAQLDTALFCDDPKLFAHVVVAEGAQREVLGCAVWFLNYSTWNGVHGIHLEDLYVRPEYRGRGFGKQLLVALAREAADQGYSRVEWSVLTWNAPSIAFYESLGATAQNEWVGYRLTGTALRELASSET
ncbi:GNAT family N-acetyltransferase [Nocardia callitridis]|uniref:GNAT family N-acetyltransferase n=2 Tax=Nocardia callitridis TaxID=648753 RepID=A0ABP9JSH6_9NOCA